MSLTQLPQQRIGTTRATAAQARLVAETLAAAFLEDPVIGWAWHDAERRREILAEFFELMVTVSLAHDEAYTTDDLAGAALWLPPIALRPSDEEAAAFAAAIERVTHEFSARVLQLFAILDDCHPHEPHYYLPIIGTRPEYQGRGIGSGLLTPVLERCDRERLPAYLEATTERNARLYLRHGFEVRREIPLPHGPSLWGMWRLPRRQGRGSGARAGLSCSRRKTGR